MRNRIGLLLFLGACIAVVSIVRLMAPHPQPPAAIILPPPPEPPSAPAPAAAPAPDILTPPPAIVPEPQLPPLPEVQIPERPIHMVPGEGAGPPVEATGRPLDLRHPEASAGQTPSAAAPPRQFGGVARATGPTGLAVGAIAVELFGIKPPTNGDRCAVASGTEACTKSAEAALATALGPGGKVNCRIPNPRPGIVIAFAICLDESGVDLGGALINAGLALADTGQSYDYVGAENIAKTLKRGLWQKR